VFVGDASEFAGGVPQGAALFDTYDDSSGNWTSGTVPGIRLGALAGAAVGSKLLLSGAELQCGNRGYQGCQPVPTRSVAVYDATSGAWSAAQLSVARAGLTAVAAGTQVLFAGGQMSGTQSLGASDRPSPTPVPSATDRPSGTPLPVTGAQTSTPPTSFSDVVDIYDTATDHWSTTQLPDPRALAVGSAGSLAIFAHQQTGERSVLDIYDTATGHWLSRPAPRVGTSPVVSGSRVLLMTTNLGPASDTIDVYDLAADAWRTITLSVPRIAPAVASIGSHTLIAGGLVDRSLAAPASDAVDILDWPTSSDAP
jgi:hypothetical protein